uniref:Glycine rich superfamily member n=1 Tax=Rhipicephalus appendiculatus TaxID=34631 RepID=A0A131Z195_RHIAP
MDSPWLTVLTLIFLCASSSSAHPHVKSFMASSFQEMETGPHGTLLGRQGYHDSAGHGRFISYVVDSDGRVHVKHDPSVKAIMTHMEQSALPHDFHWFRPLLNPASGLSSLHLLPRLHQPFMCLLNPCSADPYYNRHSDQYMRMMHGIA